MLRITDDAAAIIKEEVDGSQAKGMRIWLAGATNKEMVFGLDLDYLIEDTDTIIYGSNDAKVLCSKDVLKHLEGYTLDYDSSKINGGFLMYKEDSCGCGGNCCCSCDDSCNCCGVTDNNIDDESCRSDK